MKEKQIDEMAKALCEEYGECKKCTLSNPECENPCTVREDCERLYNAGYRKASDVAREIFAEIESCKWSETQYGDRKLCFEINSEKYAELKKKYESEKDDG